MIQYVIIRSHETEIIIRHRHSPETYFFQALKKPSAQYSFSRQKRVGANLALHDLLRGVKEFEPVSEIVIVQNTKPSSTKVEKLLCRDDYINCGE